MQSPIFSTETLFPVQRPGGRFLVKGATEPELFAGVHIDKLRAPSDLIEIETRSGMKLSLTPESVFSLIKHEGRVVLYNPPNVSLSTIRPPKWSDKVVKLEGDWRRWYIIGALLSGGSVSGDYNRPARLILLHETSRTKSIVGFLQRVSSVDDMLDKYDAQHRVSITYAGERAVITSRVLDKLVKNIIEPRSMRLFIDPLLLGREQFHGFISGLIAAMPLFLSPDGISGAATFKHRDRYIVEMIHSALNDRAGIPSVLVTSNMEPSTQYQKHGSEPHRLILSEGALRVCARLGLGGPRNTKADYTGIRQEDIIRVTPIGKQEACIVVSRQDDPDHSTANWFLFRPLFQLNADATNLATMHAVFADPAQFAQTET